MMAAPSQTKGRRQQQATSSVTVSDNQHGQPAWAARAAMLALGAYGTVQLSSLLGDTASARRTGRLLVDAVPQDDLRTRRRAIDIQAGQSRSTARPFGSDSVMTSSGCRRRGLISPKILNDVRGRSAGVERQGESNVAGDWPLREPAEQRWASWHGWPDSRDLADLDLRDYRSPVRIISRNTRDPRVTSVYERGAGRVGIRGDGLRRPPRC